MPGGDVGCSRQRCGSDLALCCGCLAQSCAATRARERSASTPATTVTERDGLFECGFLRGRLRFAASQLSEVAERRCDHVTYVAFLRFVGTISGPPL